MRHKLVYFEAEPYQNTSGGLQLRRPTGSTPSPGRATFGGWFDRMVHRYSVAMRPLVEVHVAAPGVDGVARRKEVRSLRRRLHCSPAAGCIAECTDCHPGAG
jgi:hypothetical protein